MTDIEISDADLEVGIAKQLYKALDELFGQGDQVFSMEYPPRSINPLDYAYKIKDHNSVLEKPAMVSEAEFSLSEDSFSLSPIVSAPNGKRLSNLYKSTINNYVPNLKYAAKLAKQKGRLKGWLLEEIKGTVLDYDEASDDFKETPFEGTRFEFSAKIYRTYLRKRMAHRLDVELRREIAAKDKELDSFARWLSNVAATKEAILSTFYNDAVVRGQLHEVEAAISFMDIPSIGERINSIKQELRSSVRRSPIGGGDIYDVSFQPSDWFKSLTKAPSPIDVISNKSFRESRITSKRNELQTAQNQLTSLKAMTHSKDEAKELEGQLGELQDTVDSAFQDVVKDYNNQVIETTKFVFTALAGSFTVAKTLINDQGKAIKTIIDTVSDKLHDPNLDDQIDKLVNSIFKTQKDVFSNQVKLLRTQSNLTNVRAKLELITSSDYSQRIELLEADIARFTKELKALEAEDALEPSSKQRMISEIDYKLSTLENPGDNLKSLIDTYKIDKAGHEEIKTRKLEPAEKETKQKSAIDDFILILKSHTLNDRHGANDFTVFKEDGVDALTANQDFNVAKIQSLLTDDPGNSALVNKDVLSEYATRFLKEHQGSINASNNKIKAAQIANIKTILKNAKYSDLPMYKSDSLKNEVFYDAIKNTENLEEDNNIFSSLICNSTLAANAEIARAGGIKTLNKNLEHIKNTTIKLPPDEKFIRSLLSLAKRLEISEPDDDSDYFQSIILKLTVDKNKSITAVTSDAQSQDSSGNSGWWWWDKRTTESSNMSSASTNASNYGTNLDITVKLRATKVVMNRGAWFGADLFGYSTSLYHVDPGLRSNLGYQLADYQKGFEDSAAAENYRSSAFGHFTTAFIIAKDVEIILKSEKSVQSDEQTSSQAQSSSNSSSYWEHSHSSSSHNSNYAKNEGGTTSQFKHISFPRPAIIGWFQQIVDEDKSKEYKSTHDPKAVSELEDTITEFLSGVGLSSN